MTAFDLARIGGRSALDSLLLEVRRAGELAMRLFAEGAPERAEKKPDRSPVTEADRAVENRLREYFTRVTPEIAFEGEETGRREGSELRWLVDPIDGTRAFLRGLDTWSILIGLVESREGEEVPMAGIAYLPARDQLFWGVKGHGAYVNGAPCRLSAVTALDDAAVGHGALSQFDAAGRLDLLTALSQGTYTQRGFADFANYAELLQGRLDAVIDPDVQAYDIAPAALLVQEAGGRFSDEGGAPTLRGDIFIASNGSLHSELLTLMRSRT